MVSIASHKGLCSILAFHLTAYVKMHLIPHSNFYLNKNMLLLKPVKNLNGSFVLKVLNCCYMPLVKQLKQCSGVAASRPPQCLRNPARLSLLAAVATPSQKQEL